ncbi:MAG: 3-deoxy-manno-octulosonate cytidylyltransferase [Desulfovibrionaceae bacterium]|nr:3-deoxy-manno-octulosonate cytidylyltransferase [Desulfovibrionaceae bacterium]
MRILAVIPARYSSTRLPGKPLLDICGKPMICHVYEKAKQAKALDQVIVATDDQRIVAAIEGIGGLACMTSPNCASGSDRLREVAQKYEADVYINIQGDEPLLDPVAVDNLANFMRDNLDAHVATLAFQVEKRQALNPNLVKVVCDSKGNALYFSRSLIPYDRDEEKIVKYLAHIGVYAYRAEALEAFGNLHASPLEEIEKLEQLRLLQAGIPVRVLETAAFGPGVDTIEDLECVRKIMAGGSQELSLDEKLRRIRLIITDVDGVLTDGSLYYGPEGEVLKCFNAKDGLGVGLARRAGIQIAILSGRDCQALRRRLADLGITIMRLGRLEKGEALKEILDEASCEKEEALFLGDDVTDIAGFEGCALGVAVADAHKDALCAADIVLKTKGGSGALRDVIDMIRKRRDNIY